LVGIFISVSPKIGEEFDANIHEAVMRVPRAQMPDSEPNTIAFVQKTGYNIKDQVLRPCWVGVVSE
jgi:molecular chaperone GrpE (heat shock protein)